MNDTHFIQALKEPVFLFGTQDAGAYLVNKHFVPFAQFEQEELWVFTVSTRRQLTHQAMVYRGMVDSIPVRQAELFRLAIRLNAWGILLAHNHPSGVATPSASDRQVYEATRQAGELLGIQVIDHLIVGREAWTSLREAACGWER